MHGRGEVDDIVEQIDQWNIDDLCVGRPQRAAGLVLGQVDQADAVGTRLALLRPSQGPEVDRQDVTGGDPAGQGYDLADDAAADEFGTDPPRLSGRRPRRASP